MRAEPVTLEGARVRLEPLALERHEAGLLAIALDPELWRWTVSRVASAGDLRRYLDQALAEQATGRSLPFATIERASGRVVGSTRFGAIVPEHLRVEIGWTWIGGPWQRTAINTEAKYLMLRHAFEAWGCRRVEFKTDVLNEPSRRALLRIGGHEEGVLRRHMIAACGRARDTIYYSILDDEWPRAKTRLEKMMARVYPARGTGAGAPAA